MNRNRPKIIAAVISLLLLSAAGLLLSTLTLHYSSTDMLTRQWPPVDSSEILLADEFVVAENVGEPQNTPQGTPAPQPDNTRPQPDQTHQTAQEPLLTSNRPDTPPVAAKHDANPSDEQEEKAATRQTIAKRVTFGAKNSTGQGEGSQQENPSNGTATNGAASSQLGGRTLQQWSKPTATATGTITVKVRVDRLGKVIRADYASGTGSVAALPSARQSCEKAALKSQFSVNHDAPPTQTGTITYRFN